MTLSQSSDGVTWHNNSAYYTYLNGRGEGQTRDVTMAADRTGTVFLGHLTGSVQAHDFGPSAVGISPARVPGASCSATGTWPRLAPPGACGRCAAGW